MAKATFRFKDRSEVTIEGSSLDEVMTKFRQLQEEKGLELIDLKVESAKRVRIGEV